MFAFIYICRALYYHAKPIPIQTFNEWKQNENKINVIWHDLTVLQGATSTLVYPFGPLGLDLYCRPTNQEWDERQQGETMSNHQDYDLFFDINEDGITAEEQIN